MIFLKRFDTIMQTEEVMKAVLTIILYKMITFLYHIFNRNDKKYQEKFSDKFYEKIKDEIIYPIDSFCILNSYNNEEFREPFMSMLKNINKKVIWNKNITCSKKEFSALILNNLKFFSRKLNGDVLLFETSDYNIIKDYLKPAFSHLVINDIGREMSITNGNADNFMNIILETIKNCNIKLILNIDNPLINKIKYACGNEITTYGIAQTKYDSNTPLTPSDFNYCPSCQSKLEFSSYHLPHLGVYKCPMCSFDRGTPNFLVDEVDFDKKQLKINNNIVNFFSSNFFEIYNLTLNYILASKMGILNTNVDCLNRRKENINEFIIASRKIKILKIQPDCPSTILHSLLTIPNDKKEKNLVIGFDEFSMKHKLNDISSLYNTDFSSLNEKTDKIYCIGKCKYDIATRLEFDHIDSKKIIMIKDLKDLNYKLFNESKGDIYLLVDINIIENIINILKEKDS